MSGKGAISSAFVLILLAPLLPQTGGNELKVAAQVDKTEVATGQPLLFSVTIAGTLQETPRVHLTAFQGFQIVATTQSQQIQITGGKAQQALTLTYTLASSAPGSYTLGPVKVEYHGQVYETQSIEVKVVEGPAPEPEQKPKLQGEVIL